MIASAYIYIYIEGGIKLIRSGIYGGDKDEIYFIFVSILKLKKKTNFKFLNNYKKYGGNDMAADVAQRERSIIKCYASAFSNI